MAIKKQSSNFVAKLFLSLFKRFHLMIFFVFIVGCLSGAVILINRILTDSSNDDTYTSSISAGSIDEATLNRIQSLHTSKKPGATPSVPSGRINPLSE